MARPWTVYLLRCQSGRIYTGVTPDLDARLEKHWRGKGAKFTRADPPDKLLASRQFPDHSSALREEYRIKQLKRVAKDQLVAKWQTEIS